MNTIDKDKNIQSGNVIDLNSQSKLLSICIAGRDDGYMLDFRYRITTTLNHFARSLKQLGRLDDVEILVTDWGSHFPLAQTLSLSQEAARITRFIYVPIEVIRASQNGKEGYHVSRTQNVAIRRANGEYILIYSSDTLIPQYSFESLLRLLKGEIPLKVELERTFFLLPRMDVPWQFLERQPDFEEWERYFLVSIKNTPLEQSEGFAFFGDAGALMMHRSMWNKIRGLDEPNYERGANDRELGFRVTQYYPQLSLSSIGIILYHMGHPPLRGGRHALGEKLYGLTVYNTTLYVNDENWGFGDIDLELQSPVVKNHIIKNDMNEDVSVSKKDNSELQRHTIEVFQNQIKDKDISQYVKKAIYYQKGWKFNWGDLNAFFLLAWYGHFHFPRRYLEFFTGSTPATGVVSAVCPSVEIFKVDRWEGEALSNYPLDLSYIYKMSSYRGYLRLINGEIRTAVDRLLDSFMGTFTFDLGLIKEDNLGEDIEIYLYNLLPHLAPGGALVFISSSTDSFASVLSQIKEHFPNFTLISCADNKTGMILADSIINGRHKMPLIEGVSFDTSWVQSFLARKKFKNILKPIINTWMGRVLTSLNNRFGSFLNIGC